MGVGKGGDLLLGIDVGTSATKAVLADVSGRVVASESAEHPISRPRPGWSEQSPEEWWGSSVRAVRGAMAGAGRGSVRAIGLSGQMHGLVLLSAEVAGSGGRLGRAIRPAILWNDQRTAAECARIESIAGGRAALVERVGNAALAGFTLPKILWCRAHEPASLDGAAAMMLPKDYVRFRLTGRIATDAGDASGVLLLDLARRGWDVELAARFGVEERLLPPVLEAGDVAGELSAWAAGELGLEAGIPVVAGSGDNQMGALGAGIVEEGEVLATLGTSGVIYAHADRPRPDLADAAAPGRTHTMCGATGRDGWCVTGCMLSAGGALEWCRRELFPESSIERLVDEAAGVTPGSGGLVFLPYLTGERCPYPSPEARGAWIGLTARHGRAHLVRAVLEGVAFGMAQILEIVAGLGVRVESVRVGGGGARSPLWTRIQADVYGRPVVTTAATEGPALGAALLAGVGAGVWRSAREACATLPGGGDPVLPGDPGPYGAARRVHAEAYRDLCAHFSTLTRAEG